MVGIAHIHRAVSVFGQWWLRECRAALPDSLCAWLDARRTARLVIQPEEAGPTATLLDRQGAVIFTQREPWRTYSRPTFEAWRQAAAAHDGDCELVLSLSGADVIGQHLVLPAQAASHIDDILRDHIARKTPLPADRVLFGHVAAPLEGARIGVRYAILPKDRLQQVLARLSLTAGEVAAVVGPQDSAGRPVFIRLAPEPPRMPPRAKRVAAVLAAACLGLTLFGAGAMAWRQQALLQEVERRAGEIAGPAKEVATQLKDFQDASALLDELAALRDSPGLVQLWEELAQLLPETTYLTEVDVRGQDLQITGFSAAATDLIHVLEQSQVLSEVVLSGPVVTDRATAKERFSLRAKLRKARLSLEQNE